MSLSIALAAVASLISAIAFASPAVALEQRLIASDGAAGDELGSSVAIDGDTLAVGAPFKNGGTGAVYVYQWLFGGWEPAAKLTASDGAEGDWLGRSVAIDGDTIVAGAVGDDVSENTADGSVYTFARTGGATRTETAKLTASDGANDWLGESVAIDGDTIVAGALNDNAGRGTVYTFARLGAATRTETAKLTASDGAGGDWLGRSVAIDGNTIVAGVPGDFDANTNQGAVYTFARTGTAARTETAKLTASDGADDDYFGSSVAIDGNTIVAGRSTDDVGFDPGEGSVYTYARAGAAARTETAKLTVSGASGAPGDFLGYSVAIDGDTIVAGAPGDNVDLNSQRGSALVFPLPPDSDADGVPDATDACPTGATGWTSDATTDDDFDGCRDADEDTDDDNDTVADGSDGCPVIAASTVSGCPDVSRSLTLTYSKSKDIFKGLLSASEPSCVSNDRVTLWRQVKGADAKVGADEVNARGGYVVPKRERPGRYYSTVEERVVPGVAACGSATSPTLRLR